MGMVNSGSKPSDSPFPQIDWKPEPPGCASTFGVANLVVLGLLSVGALAYAVTVGVAKHNIATAIGAGGMTATLGCLLILSTGKYGRNKKVRRHVDAVQGAGLAFGSRRGFLILLVCLLGGAVFCFAAWLGFTAGTHDDGLLPASKNNSGGATVVAIFGWAFLGCIILLCFFYARQTIELYPGGVRRVMVRPFLARRQEQFIEWTDIDSITLNIIEQPTYGGTTKQQVVEIHIRTPRQPVQYKKFDTPDTIGIIGSLLVCPPSLMLAILHYLHTHPDQRQFLQRPDAPSWFTQLSQHRAERDTSTSTKDTTS